MLSPTPHPRQVEGLKLRESSPSTQHLSTQQLSLRSTPQALVLLAQRNGWRSLYAGLSINYLKVVPSTAIGELPTARPGLLPACLPACFTCWPACLPACILACMLACVLQSNYASALLARQVALLVRQPPTRQLFDRTSALARSERPPHRLSSLPRTCRFHPLRLPQVCSGAAHQPMMPPSTGPPTGQPPTLVATQPTPCTAARCSARSVPSRPAGCSIQPSTASLVHYSTALRCTASLHVPP